MKSASEIEGLADRWGVLVLDGGLATELERRGLDVDDRLWSAKVLADDPEAIEQLHFDYLEAGADCIITASYQASFRGFEASGWSHLQAAELIERSVRLAEAARRRFLGGDAGMGSATTDSLPEMAAGSPAAGRRPIPLIAASIGPYAAYLHDGSEYHGRYSITTAELVDFHRERFHLLVDCRPDLLACETIPSIAEARALSELLRSEPQASAWFAFTCADAGTTTHGDSLAECVRLLAEEPQVVAIGVNCTPPQWIEPAIRTIRRNTSKPIVVYPNSGAEWDAQARCWKGKSEPLDFAELAVPWRTAGARLIGGCCRTGPEHIRRLRQQLGRP